MKNFIRTFAGLGFLVGSLAYDAKQSTGTSKYNDFNGWDLTVVEYADSKTAVADKEKRKTASEQRPASEMQFKESNITPGVREFREKLLGEKGFHAVVTGEQLANLIKDFLEPEKFKTLDNDTKFFLAPLYAVIPLRGIVWRSRKLFETAGIGNKATHGQSVQLVRNVMKAVDTFFPAHQWDAAMEYLTEPHPDPKVRQFENIYELQKFVVNEYIGGLRKAENVLQELYSQNPSGIYVWDSKISFGQSAFQDGIRRYVGFGKAEMEIALSGIHRMMFEGYTFVAYDQNQLG